MNAAVAVLALVSFAEHETRVRPTLNELPDFGVQRVASAPSRSSRAVTRKATRAVLSPRFAVTTLFAAQAMVGRVTSNSSPGTTSVPVHVSVPEPALTERSTVPPPEAPS